MRHLLHDILTQNLWGAHYNIFSSMTEADARGVCITLPSPQSFPLVVLNGVDSLTLG